MNGPERVIFGFHTVLARLRAEPKSVLEVFLDETRRDARAKDFAAQVERAGARLMRVPSTRLSRMAAFRAAFHRPDAMFSPARWTTASRPSSPAA